MNIGGVLQKKRTAFFLSHSMHNASFFNAPTIFGKKIVGIAQKSKIYDTTRLIAE